MQRTSGPRSKPWMYFFLGYALLTAVALMAAVLFVQFIQNRPADIRRHCTYLATQLENVLYEYLPERNVHRGAGEERSDDRGRWLFYRIEAIETPQVKADGLKEIIRDAMLDKYVRIVDATGSDGKPELRASIYDRDFAAIVFVASKGTIPDRADWRRRCQSIAREVEETLLRAGLPASSVTRSQPEGRSDDKMQWSFTKIEVSLPASRTPAELRPALEEALTALEGLTGGDDKQLTVTYRGKQCVALNWKMAGGAPEKTPAPAEQTREGEGMASPDETPHMPSFDELPLDSVDHPAPEASGLPPAGRETPRPPEVTPRIAIILDDGGYANPDKDPALALDSHLTFAILPGTPYDEKLARRGKELGFEIMLHMPMQTDSKTIKPFPGEITTKMDETVIRDNTLKAIAEIPGLVGVNNHTGSKFTSDRERMKIFLKVLSENGLFFVDSKTIASSVGRSIAEEIGVPVAERDIFLDNESDTDLIVAQFDKLVARAKRKGQAIGIGHFRKNTIAALADLLPKLEKEGIELVHVSELLQ